MKKRGGKRIGAGRKQLQPGQKKVNTNFHLKKEIVENLGISRVRELSEWVCTAMFLQETFSIDNLYDAIKDELFYKLGLLYNEGKNTISIENSSFNGLWIDIEISFYVNHNNCFSEVEIDSLSFNYSDFEIKPGINKQDILNEISRHF